LVQARFNTTGLPGAAALADDAAIATALNLTMTAQRRRFLQTLSVLALQASAHAQGAAWPARPVRVIAGGAGGVTDIRARWLSERLVAQLGQALVVENLPAAGGTVAAEAVARAKPDGHTLLFTHQGISAINPHLYPRHSVDMLEDFAPVARFGIGMLVLVVPAASPLSSVQDLLAQARARPGVLNFASPGNGTPPHLSAELLKRLAAINATHVPYQGGGAMITSLLGGQVDFAIEGLTTTLPQVRAGRLRALAISGSQRSPALPDVPTMAEAGVPGYDYIGWTGVLAPAATPEAVVERLNRAINQIAVGAEGRLWFQSLAAEAGEQSPEEFGAFIRAEHARWGRLIRVAGLRAE
jgi:tripartite-type tricarboxylate transporter receptor subunit TctC